MRIYRAEDERFLKLERHATDLAIVGGGLAGVCCAITAARQGLGVVLIQDRPVLGGNASSEVRLWVLGATSHMGNNNRWAREGGVIDELLVENMYRNPEGNALIFDSILLEKVAAEENITLLLNTAAFEVDKGEEEAIEAIRAFCSQNSTMYEVRAPYFCDASGDGVLGFLSGAAFRIGAEGRAEFDEGFAPTGSYGELLGHSIYFYTKDVGHPVKYVPPAFALNDIAEIPRYRRFNARDYGCNLWWIEYGGRMDTVHDTEKIKWELWKVVYGVWDHIKNSGEFPEAESLTLEWVGTIPGKRESRRFEGDFMLSQRDVVERRRFDDAVSFGGWAMDLHPADGVYSKEEGCTQWHSKGVYQIPLRTMYSKNVPNLFLAGRIISASHVAFGSTRVMATCAHGAQAVATAAAMCCEREIVPRDLLDRDLMRTLQRRLLRQGQHIPGLSLRDTDDLAESAEVVSSSAYSLDELGDCGETLAMDSSRGLLLPMRAGRVPSVSMWFDGELGTELTLELRGMGCAGNFTPEEILATQTVTLGEGGAVSSEKKVATVGGQTEAATLPASGAYHKVTVDFGVELDRDQYVMIGVKESESVSIVLSDVRLTGVLSLAHKADKKVSKGGAVQDPPEGIGVDRFEFWLPERRPGGKLPAVRFEPPIEVFDAESVLRGPERPVETSNAWVASLEDTEPWIELNWKRDQEISRVVVSFDSDLDHPMESVLMGHPERVMPYCVRRARLLDGDGHVLARLEDNHQTRWVVDLKRKVKTKKLRLECERPSANVPASVFRVRCFA